MGTNRVYIITCNNKIDSLGFATELEAIKYIESKPGGVTMITGWEYVSNDNRLIYKIHDINIKQ